MQVGVVVLVPYDSVLEFEFFSCTKIWFKGIFVVWSVDQQLEESNHIKSEVKIQFEVNNSWFGKSMNSRS